MAAASPSLEKVRPARGKRRVGRPSAMENGGASLIAVLSLVRDGFATTRLEIEKRAELGRAIVADRLNMLERLGLVEQGDLGPAIGGRAPRHMRFRADAGGVLVAHVDRGSLAVGLADLAGALIVEHHEAVDLSLGPNAIVERLTALFIWLLDERGGRNKAWGIGLALPEVALVDAHDGELFYTAGLDLLQAWRNFDFATEFSLRFGAPCFVSGATQMLTLGEMRAGGARGVLDVLCVRLDRSVSAGVASNGRLHRGAQGRAGLIGHAPTGEAEDVICHCGARGCLDVVASGEALARQALAEARAGHSRYLAEVIERQGEVTANEVIQGAQLGDALCAEMLARSGGWSEKRWRRSSTSSTRQSSCWRASSPIRERFCWRPSAKASTGSRIRSRRATFGLSAPSLQARRNSSGLRPSCWTVCSIRHARANGSHSARLECSLPLWNFSRARKRNGVGGRPFRRARQFPRPQPDPRQRRSPDLAEAWVSRQGLANPDSRPVMETKGLGPHGERPFPADKLVLTEADADHARAGAFKAAIVLHTTASDWSRHELDGIVTTLNRHGAKVCEVVDCGYDKVRQNRELMRLAEAPIDVVISLPIGSSVVAEGHRRWLGRARNWCCLTTRLPVSGRGWTMCPYRPRTISGSAPSRRNLPRLTSRWKGSSGILTYESEFFVTNEREIAFRKWMGAERPDATVVRGRFRRVDEGETAYMELLRANEDLDAIFVAWDVPALGVLAAIKKGARPLPMVTVDLGEDVAEELGRGGPLKGIAAQRPYHQGMAAALAALLSLIGRIPPVWISSTGLKVTKENLRQAVDDICRFRSAL